MKRFTLPALFVFMSTAFVIMMIAVGMNETACTPQQAQSADSVAIDLTDALCAIAENQPLGQPWVDIVCTVASPIEQGIATLVSDGGALASGSGPNAIRTVTLRLPSAEAAQFLASHKAMGRRVFASSSSSGTGPPNDGAGYDSSPIPSYGNLCCVQNGSQPRDSGQTYCNAGVGTRPPSATSRPELRSPATVAFDTAGLETRPSWPTRTSPAAK